MRIPPETIRSLVGLHTQRVSRSQAAGSNTGVASAARALTTDTISLSDEAAMLNTLKAGVRAMPDVDEARVRSIRAELAAGDFAIQPQRVAEGLVLELTGLA